MGVQIVNRILSGFLALLSLLLLITCIWILTSLFINDPTKIHANCTATSENDATPAPCSENEYHEADVVDAPRKVTLNDIWNDFNQMNSMFYHIIIVFVCTVIGTSIVQFICSCVLLFSPSFKIASRSRKIVGILFAVFILCLISLAVPVAIKREPDIMNEYSHTMSTLNSEIKRFLSTLEWNTLLHDLNMYYLELLFNSFYLFLYMITTCCLLRCSGSYQEFDP